MACNPRAKPLAVVFSCVVIARVQGEPSGLPVPLALRAFPARMDQTVPVPEGRKEIPVVPALREIPASHHRLALQAWTQPRPAPKDRQGPSLVIQVRKAPAAFPARPVWMKNLLKVRLASRVIPVKKQPSCNCSTAATWD